MRLTLRTLLAWLDGVLPAEDQKLLGDRVAASTVASHIVDRIRAAVARSVLPAPRVVAKGIADDPNSVAEYLDNSLPSEQLEPFERVCIESEVHLAEVAACHGILAAVSRSPHRNGSLPEIDRSRLQARVQRRLVWERERPAELAGHAPHATADRERALRESRETARALRAALGQPVADDAAAVDGMAPAAGAFGGGLTAPSPGSWVEPATVGPRRSSAAAWLSAGLAAASLVALGGVLGWSLLRANVRDRGGEVAARTTTPPPLPEPAAPPPEPAAAAKPADPAEPRDELPLADAGRPTAPETRTEPAANPAVAQPAGATAVAAAPAPASADAAVALPAAPPTAPGAAAVVTPPVPVAGQGPVPPVQPPAPAPQQMAAVGPLAAATIPQPAEGDASKPVTPLPGPPPLPSAAIGGPAPGRGPGGEDEPDIGFVGAEGVLLRRAGPDGEWTFMPPNSPLRSREDLLVPPGCHPELNVAGVTVRLMPATRASVSVDPDGTPRITISSGQLVARAGRADARLGISAAGLSGTIEAGLAEPVAVQVELTRFPGGRPGDSRVRAEIIAPSRGIVWRQSEADGRPAAQPLEGIDVQGMLPAGTALEWDSVSPRRASVARETSLPSWVTASPLSDRLEKSARDALAGKLAAAPQVTRSLRELVTDKRVENRMTAAATLALLGEFDDLVDLLCGESPGKRLEARQWTALEGSAVPPALAGGDVTAAALKKSLEDHGPNGKAEALWSMACGFSDAQIFAGEDRVLVERLEDPSLVVRRYAHKCLVDIVQPSAADRLRYRADAPPDLRREGVTWWRNQAEKGLIRRPGGTPQTAPADGFAEPKEASQ